MLSQDLHSRCYMRDSPNSPIVICNFMLFVRKKFYKSVTLLKCSLGYGDHVEKICKKLHDGNTCFQAPFCVCACVKWLKYNISECVHVIYHFFAFFLLNNFVAGTKPWKFIQNEIFLKEFNIDLLNYPIFFQLETLKSITAEDKSQKSSFIYSHLEKFGSFLTS